MKNVQVMIYGACGRMGRTLVRCLVEQQVEGLRLAAAVESLGCPHLGENAGTLAGTSSSEINITSDIESALEGVDAVIDFSSPAGTSALASSMPTGSAAWVIGTTGLEEDHQDAIRKVASSNAVVQAPNMSLGVNVLLSLVRQAAAALYTQEYDIEIIERHHRMKKDSPSGTALGLGEAAAEGAGLDLPQVSQHGREGKRSDDRPREEIGFHAVRGGDFVGDHTVVLAGDGECVELSHRATRRETFALGALRAARWAAGQPPGLYTMQDVLQIQRAT